MTPPPAPTTDRIGQKRTRDLILMSVLLVVFVFLFSKNVLLRKNKPVPRPAAQTTAPAVPQSLPDELVFVANTRVNDKLNEDQQKLWENEWGRDPFIPQAAFSSIAKAVNLTLKGILWDDKNPKAIVNEKTLLTGDAIYGYTVVEIRRRSVILRTGEKNIELQVFRPILAENGPSS